MNEYHATKYDSAAHEVIAILSDVAEGYGKDSVGDVEAPTGYFTLVILDDSCDLDLSDTTGAYPTGDLAGETAREYGVTGEMVAGAHVVTTNSQGFVSVEKFPTAELAQARFDCLAGQYEAWDTDDELYVCPVYGHGYHSVVPDCNNPGPNCEEHAGSCD